MAIGISIVSFCPFLLISAPNYELFLLSWIPFGAAVGLYVPSAQTQISLIESKTSKIITPVYQAFYSLGSLCGAIIAGVFIKNRPDPKITFAVFGFCLIIKPSNYKKVIRLFPKKYKPYIIGKITKNSEKVKLSGKVIW